MKNFSNIVRKNEDKKIFFLSIILMFFLGGLVLYKWSQFDMPASTTDELGYLSFPAQIAGLDWKDLMQYTDYYGKGYGFLLIPFYILFFEQPWIIYKLLIALNLFLLILSFYISLYCAKYLFPSWKPIIRLMGCFVLILYPTNIFYSHLALPEVLLMFLLWISIFSLIKFEQKQHFRWLIGFLITLGYMFVTHIRTIGILFAGAVSILYLFYKKKIKRKHIFATIFMFFAILMLWKLIQYFHYEYIGGINDFNQANVEVIEVESIFNIFIECLKNIKSFVYAIVGRLFYLFITGNMIFFVGISSLFGVAYKIIKSNILKKEYEKYEIVYLFIIIAFVVTLLEGATGGVRVRRVDGAVYGRYIENTIAPILLLGMFKITTHVKKFYMYIFSYITSIICLSPIVEYMMNQAEQKYFISDSAVGLGAFFPRDMREVNCREGLFYALFTAITISFIISILYFIKMQETRKMLVLLSIVMLFWVGLERLCEKDFFQLRQGLQYKYIDQIYAILEIDENADVIYIRNTDPYCTAAKYVQFLLSDRSVKVINQSDFSDYPIERESFIMAYDRDNYLDEKYELLLETNDLTVYKTQNK